MTGLAQETGVYYAPGDCAGFLRRVLIDVVDGVVLVLVWMATWAGLAAMRVPLALMANLYFLAIVGSSFAYLVVMKRYWRTLGYIVCGAEVVSIDGGRPTLLALVVRAAFWVLGPRTALVDLIWLMGDPRGQALRDKYGRMYVVKRKRAPAGRGAIRYVWVDIVGYALVLPEVGGAHAQNRAPLE
jgi:uncharacterized RDD family membrane protein YckC